MIVSVIANKCYITVAGIVILYVLRLANIVQVLGGKIAPCNFCNVWGRGTAPPRPYPDGTGRVNGIGMKRRGLSDFIVEPFLSVYIHIRCFKIRPSVTIIRRNICEENVCRERLSPLGETCSLDGYCRLKALAITAAVVNE